MHTTGKVTSSAFRWCASIWGWARNGLGRANFDWTSCWLLLRSRQAALARSLSPQMLRRASPWSSVGAGPPSRQPLPCCQPRRRPACLPIPRQSLLVSSPVSSTACSQQQSLLSSSRDCWPSAAPELAEQQHSSPQGRSGSMGLGGAFPAVFGPYLRDRPAVPSAWEDTDVGLVDGNTELWLSSPSRPSPG